MPRHTPPRTTAALAAIAGVVSALCGALWYATLMQEVWAAEALGPICRHGGTLALHCPSCYAALAMFAGGLVSAAVALGAPKPSPSVARTRRHP